MPTIECTRSVAVCRTPRVMQLEGMFDIPPTQRSEVGWSAHLPLEDRDWTIGLIVGPSGCGKTTLARELFGKRIVDRLDWPADRSLVDAFPPALGIKEITLLLSSVGFSSPPSWLRPFHALSNGEQFRVTIARALAEPTDLVVIDEFTSVVDRTVARIGSSAIAKTIRRRAGSHSAEGRPPQQFVAVSCHYDIIDWLQPDWIYEPAGDAFQWRCERPGQPTQDRPPIGITISRTQRDVWRLFEQHHYLDGNLSRAARCFLGSIEGRPAAFIAVLSFPHPRRSGWREHRAVCLPDFQGVGVGNAMSEYTAALFVATGKPYYSTTGSPAMIRHRARSPLWRMCRKPSLTKGHGGIAGMRNVSTRQRLTAGFEYIGPARKDEARGFGLL